MAVLTEEQSMLREAARSWTQEKSPLKAFRKMRDTGNPRGFDVAAWKDQAALGWAGVIIPEEFGGAGLGVFDLGLVLEEMGRTLTASPLLATGLAGASAVLVAGSDAQKRQWLPKIADGSAIATLAVEEGPRHAPQTIALSAAKSGSGYRLSGKKCFVIEGPSADVFVVSARTSGGPSDCDGISLFLVAANAAGVSRQDLKTIDHRGVSNVFFKNVPGELLGAAGQGWAPLEASLDRARAGVTAEMLGAAEAAFAMTLDYLKTRVQFGRQIGSFQALQHRAARILTELELARSPVEAALQAISAAAPEAAALVSLAKSKMGDTLRLVSNETIQMHGGIGMTDECDAGLFLKRARVLEALFGNQAYHRERYARILGY
jgi:alkylation response protein AidB-like acyl-CoA dehydrogenase